MKKYAFIAAVTLTGSLWGAEGNLASADPGFEHGSKYFYFMSPKEYGTFAKEGKDGSQAVKIENTSGSPARRGGLYRKNFIPAVGGRTYTFSVDCKSSLSAGYASARINAFKKGNNGQNHYLKTFETPRITGKNGKWERLQSTFTIPKDAELLHFELSARDFTGSVLFDNVCMTEGDGALKLPLLKSALRMDGKWDSEFEKNALRLKDFSLFPIHDNAPAPEDTEVLIAQTHDTIYGVFLLHHPKERKLKADVTAKDGPLWEDDSAEIFITQTNSDRPYYHFIMNTAGGVFDALEINDKWNSSIKSTGGRLNDTCDFIQFALPLADIGYNAELDAHLHKLSWRMNFTRSHRYGAKSVQYSTFAKVIGFHNPEGFIPFEGLTGGKPDTVSVRYFNKGVAESSMKVRQNRYWKVEKPLYRELLSDTPNPLKGESAFIWNRPIEKKPNTEFAIQYGQAYTQKMMLDEYEKNRLHPYSAVDIPMLTAWGSKSGVGLALYAPYYMNNYSFIYSMENRKKFLDEVRSILAKHHSGIWAVSLGDEVASQVLRRFITRANKPEELAKDPALRQAVNDIREKYGFGKYSVPKSVHSDEPFAWIALRRWAFDNMLETQKELYKICGEYKGTGGKPVKVISSDHVDWGFMQYQSRFGEWQDIATAQVLPSNDPARQTIAYRAKLLRDLTGNSVWLCAHVEPYAGNYTCEETAAFLSEAVRGGGSGLQIWNYDLRAEQRNMGCSQFDYYGHRPRWNTIMDCARRMREDNTAKYPEADFAVMVSNDTAFSHPKMRFAHYEAAFNLLGPGAGAWFKFISDTQLLDGKVTLDKWKLLVLPKGSIISRAIADKLTNFVKNGGTLLCLDPDFMEFDINGENTSAMREKLFGAKTVKAPGYAAMHFTGKAPFAGAGTAELPAGGAKRRLEPLTGTETLALFPDGKTAVTVKKYPGGGRAILSAVEVQFYQNANPAWRKAFKEMLKSCKIKTGQNIWRFLYPHKPEKEPVFNSKCLTGNNFYWWNNEVKAPANVTLPKAFYTYSLAPDGEKGAVKYSFADGRLTNRLKAPFAGDMANRNNRALIKSGKLHRGLFADTWSNTGAFEIKFELGAKVTLDRAAIFWHGDLPEKTVVFGDDGREYICGGGKTDGVLKTEALLPSLKTRTLTFRIPARTGKLTLSEIEIWGAN